MVEIHFLAGFQRDLFHAPIVGIQRDDGGAGQLAGELPRQFCFPRAGRSGDANNVRFHSVEGEVISVYNPTTASTRPSTVNIRASASTARPKPRAVAVVTGPIDATLT